MKIKQTSFYVCPTTKNPLFFGANGLYSNKGNRYAMIFSEGDFLVHDFNHQAEKDENTKAAKMMYDHSDAVSIYRNFLDWLFATFNENESEFRKSLISELKISSNDKILITGCGLGEDVMILLDDQFFNGEIHANDISQEMVLHTTKRVLKRPYKKARVFCSVCDATKLPYPDNFFDKAFHFGGINLFSDIKKGISEMDRVVKPGGRVLFGDEGVAPWLKDTEFGKIAINNNRLWNADIPLKLLPVNAKDIQVSWRLGNCFYIVSYEVSNELPFINYDIPHKGWRGGTMRTRYFGDLEGVTKGSKDFVIEDSKRSGISVHEWLEKVIHEKKNCTSRG